MGVQLHGVDRQFRRKWPRLGFFSLAGLLMCAVALLIVRAHNTEAAARIRVASGPNSPTYGTLYYSRVTTPSSNLDTIYSALGDGSAQTVITTGDWPRLSPDQNFLAFVHSNSGSTTYAYQRDLYVHNLTTGAENMVGQNPDYIVNYAFSTDSQQVVYDYGSGIYRKDRNGTGAAYNGAYRYTSVQSGYDDAPQVAPAGTPMSGTLAFYEWSVGIKLMDFNDSNYRVLTNTVAGDNFPVWSPDGQWISFGYSPDTSSFHNTSYYKTHPDGTGLTLLASIPNSCTDAMHSGATWTPDGSLILLPATVGGVNGIYAIPSDGSQVISRVPVPSGPDVDFVGAATGSVATVSVTNFACAVTATPTDTASPTSTGTSTPTDTATDTPTDTPTSTSTSTPTDTATGTASSTAISTSTATTTPSSTATETPTLTSTPPSTSTSAPSATGTSTRTATYTATRTPTLTRTTMPSSTSTNTVTATATGTAAPCASGNYYTDEPPTTTFYSYVQCLTCKGVVSGFPDGTFREGAPITRGQIAKIVSNAAGFFEDPGDQIYSDVPPGSPFYAYINRLTNRHIVSGYPCPTKPGETAPGDTPCTPENPQLFRPNFNATRGQLAKIVSNAAGYSEAVSGQYYADVPPSGDGSQFYTYIMRLTNRGVMSGYQCGTPDPRSGPCDDQHRPYFRPGNEVTRGQAAKIVANTFFPNCQTR